MKRIVLLCDGTWNSADSRHPTNVVKTAQCLEPAGPDGVCQVPIYIPGVGTGKGVTALSRFADKTLGGALGWGLLDNIAEAYRHLVFTYEPGDEIYIFGFSRGAYTARSLAGMIRSTGIIPRDRLDHIPRAVLRYKTVGDPTTKPSSEESHAFRAEVSPSVATSEAEVAWRAAQGLEEPYLLRITYVGIWDTVGALGVPSHLSIAGLFNRGQYGFHDLELSSSVHAARHAVALDERRATFPPTLWSNLDNLNQRNRAPIHNYQQLYFAGDHGSVGGGGDLTHLSNIALRWVLEGARLRGLSFDQQHLEVIERETDAMGPLINTSTPADGIFQKVLRRSQKDREGPSDTSEMHDAPLIRWLDDPDYRPGSLKRVEVKLAALAEERSRKFA
ncbi:DUF2235 domain-containing protein [Donghicola sp. XS_ASV15]|uniref:DUF2235 domain-containing protein n=1 Tax=Donghicola sp. XS_ASV15 TaxID=3241295 RepID=UPI0035146A87